MGSFTERGNKFEVALLVPDVTDELIPPDSMTLLVLIKQRQPLLVPVGHLRLLSCIIIHAVRALWLPTSTTRAL